LKLFRIRSHEQFINHSMQTAHLLADHMNYLANQTPVKRSGFKIPGYSYTAGKQVEFIVDYQHAGENGGVVWRERVCCPVTYFNNRMRATFHLFDIEMEPYSDKQIYITEQVTPIYRYFADRFPQTSGSEFLGDIVPLGSKNIAGIRNENLCNLTFDDNFFDTLISLDVFEHIPNYQSAFSECARVLKSGGKMMWSVPFVSTFSKNSIRARMVNGSIQHDLPPEYHGDPLSDKGVLCFQHFGWEMLDQIKTAGFSDAYAICYYSKEFGYLGGEQFMFVAVK
jgi:SAM-dependent methyltransferase